MSTLKIRQIQKQFIAKHYFQGLHPRLHFLFYANELNEKRLAIMYKGIAFTLCKLLWVSWELLVLSLFFDWYYNISNGEYLDSIESVELQILSKS